MLTIKYRNLFTFYIYTFSLKFFFVVFIYFIELLVAFLQAYIFAFLTAVFIAQAFEGEHHHEEPVLVKSD